MKVNLLNPYLVHPTTGGLLTPQSFQGKRGTVIVPPVMGGAPDDGDPGTGSGEGGTGSGGAGTGGDPAGGSGGSGGTDTGSSEGEETIPLSKFKQQEEQLRAADRKRAEYEAKLKEIEDKDKSELERATGKAKELEATVSQLQEEVNTLRVQNAFLMGNSYTWHDAEDALALAQRKGFLDEAINKETGEINQDKVKAGLKKFAEAHKHLIKESSGEENKGKGGAGKGGTGQAPPPVGSNGAGNKGGKGTDEDALRQRYRSLRN